MRSAKVTYHSVGRDLPRAAVHQGVVDQILDWTKCFAKSSGKDYLRLDCAIRPKLCAVYERNGFVKHSEWAFKLFRVARYEYDLHG